MASPQGFWVWLSSSWILGAAFPRGAFCCILSAYLHLLPAPADPFSGDSLSLSALASLGEQSLSCELAFHFGIHHAFRLSPHCLPGLGLEATAAAGVAAPGKTR